MLPNLGFVMLHRILTKSLVRLPASPSLATKVDRVGSQSHQIDHKIELHSAPIITLDP